jgi:uncharacterized protein (TIGR03437 family)
MVINKTRGDLTANISLASFKPAATAQMWLYGRNHLKSIVRGPDFPVSADGFTASFPAYSITLLVLPAASDTLAAPQPVVDAVTNGASFTPVISPGAVVVISGKGLGPAKLVSFRASTSGMVATSLNGTRVLFDGTPAPVLYTMADLVSAVVPYVAALKSTTHVQIEYLGSRSAPVEIPVSAVAPGIFTLDGSGHGQGSVRNSDGSRNSPANPAARGSDVAIFATGEGQTGPPGVDGKIGGRILSKPLVAVSVRIGGVTAAPTYAGTASAAVAGVLQIDLKIPGSIPPGSAVPLEIQIGTATSQPNITMAVK